MLLASNDSYFHANGYREPLGSYYIKINRTGNIFTLVSIYSIVKISCEFNLCEL